MNESFSIRGFNLCESILRHTPDQLRSFIRRMKLLNMNTLIVHYDYGWKRYKKLIIEECKVAGVNIILMTFGPRTFWSYTDWKKDWFAKNESGETFMQRLECETQPCGFSQEGIEAFSYGATQWLKSLEPEIRDVHMRAADGIMFCRCEKCRNIPVQERWQPYVEAFIKAVLNTRPDLNFETDIYVSRYEMPRNVEAHKSMTQAMYDTFYRNNFFPIGSVRDTINADVMKYAAGHEHWDAPTPNSYHLKRLKEWSALMPGRVYIHENAMAQGLLGTFQHCTGVCLDDLETYHELGIKGVCYEAYEPGYKFFERNFEILADALTNLYNVRKNYKASHLEQKLRTCDKMRLFCDDPSFPLQEYLSDPLLLKQAKLFRECWCGMTADIYRKYLDFAFEHADIMDYLMIGFQAKGGLIFKKIKFKDLSEQAQNLLNRRKLWDFMEDIPIGEDPIAVTRKLIEELYEKVENL